MRTRDRRQRVTRVDDVRDRRCAWRARHACPDRHAIVPDDRAQRSRSDDRIGAEMHHALVALERRAGLLAHVAVERAVVDAAAHEQELEHRDVPAEVALPERARPEERPAERPERGARVDVGGADSQVMAALEGVYRSRRSRPGDPVDRGEVEPVRAQGDLQPGDLWVSEACAAAGAASAATARMTPRRRTRPDPSARMRAVPPRAWRFGCRRTAPSGRHASAATGRPRSGSAASASCAPSRPGRGTGCSSRSGG